MACHVLQAQDKDRLAEFPIQITGLELRVPEFPLQKLCIKSVPGGNTQYLISGFAYRGITPGISGIFTAKTKAC